MVKIYKIIYTGGASDGKNDDEYDDSLKFVLIQKMTECRKSGNSKGYYLASKGEDDNPIRYLIEYGGEIRNSHDSLKDFLIHPYSIIQVTRIKEVNESETKQRHIYDCPNINFQYDLVSNNDENVIEREYEEENKEEDEKEEKNDEENEEENKDENNELLEVSLDNMDLEELTPMNIENLKNIDTINIDDYNNFIYEDEEDVSSHEENKIQDDNLEKEIQECDTMIKEAENEYNKKLQLLNEQEQLLINKKNQIEELKKKKNNNEKHLNL